MVVEAIKRWIRSNVWTKLEADARYYTQAQITALLAGYLPTNYYATGTFTPDLTFGGANVGMTWSSRSGRYIKIGNLIYVSADMRLSAKGSSTGGAKVTGLPFTAANDDAVGNAVVLWYQMATNWVFIAGAVEKNTTNFFLVGLTAAGASYTSLLNSDFANNSILSFTCTYEKVA